MEVTAAEFSSDRGGTRGAPPRRKFGRDNSSKSGGVNVIGGKDEQYNEYYDKLQGYDDTSSLNNVNGELDQETIEAAEAGTSAD
jgi:hypothetical protein